jgi:predicted KAP-like P-loop ATPase
MEMTAGFTLLGDQPCITGSDSLGFERIADDLAALIMSSKESTPFTIGIEGGWGSGKSSLMGRIERKLRASNTSGKGGSKVTTVWFNAWTADDGRVLEGLIKSVLDELDHNILRKLARKKELLSWARVAVTVVASWLKLDTIVDQIWHKLEVDPQARNEMRDLMVQAIEEWRNKRDLDPEHLLVVCIDDLDRCSPQNVFQAFEAMKLYLDAPGLVFVVGFDESVVSDAILHEKQYSKSVTSRQYLEKVIQIRYRIPPASDNQSRELIRAYMNQSSTTQLFDDSSQSLVIERNTRNPRRIKRFINGFILEYKLDPEWEQLGADHLHVLPRVRGAARRAVVSRSD